MKLSTENGLSLIEVLVSLVLLSIAVLGAMSMYLTAHRTAQQSFFRTQASHLVAELADRMRINATVMRKADSDNPYLQIDHRISQSSIDMPDCYGDSGSCAAEQLVQFDINEWLARANEVLPEGRVKVCRDGTPWNDAAQEFNWDCSNDSSAPVVVKIGWLDKTVEQENGGVTIIAPHTVLAISSPV